MSVRWLSRLKKGRRKENKQSMNRIELMQEEVLYNEKRIKN